MPGIEHGTSHVRSMRSATELDPHLPASGMNRQAQLCCKMPVCPLKSILQMVSILLTKASSADVDCTKHNPLPKPILSLDPPTSVILLGENISLVCHFPLTRCNVDFYRNHKEQLTYLNEVDCIAKVMLEADIKWKGNNAYTCEYQKYFENNKTWACSPHSDPVMLIVTDKLPKPTFSIEPFSGVVTVGERVQFNCTTSYPSPIAHLYKKHGRTRLDTRNVSDSQRSVILTMKDLEPEDSGEYSCSFEKTLKGQVYNSERSNFVEVNVTEKLPKPTVSIEPFSGVVTVGERVQFNCTTSFPSPIFHLYKKHGKKPLDTRNVSDSQRSVILTMNGLEPEDSGEYSCGFEKMVKGKVYESESSNFVELNVNEKLPKPTVSIEPFSGVVTVGERVQFNCTTSFPSPIFHLYKKHGKKPLDTRNVSDSQRSVILTMNGLEPEDSGEYSCGFEKMVKGKVYESESSNFVELNVNDKLPKPTVSIQPVSGVVTVGERVQFNCTTSYPSPIAHLYKKHGRMRLDTRNVSDSQRSVILTMKDLEPVDSGEYSCSFMKTVKGKVYESERSNFMEVSVTATLPRANISVNPSSGVVSRKSTIRITCTGSILNPGGCFHLYRDGEENGTLDVSGPQQSITFTINDTNIDGTWDYTCSYSRTVKKTLYQSPESDAVQVTVKSAGNTVLIVSVCVALMLILILGALAGYLYRKNNASVPSSNNNNEDNAVEPDVLYASLNPAALNRRVVNPHAQPQSWPDNEETCVYAEMKVR
ncbi:alpha-1B-glycoprotein-like [Carcharodon carcharias]|uniref:alpha-1B-glycoprotein-like n=1 Tax=Carcharodon carcharias TaxID=13397 RepID=UPI001B7EB78C|nr:alpha-1B-glycoprotein-like [Carcharodon carcharias]